MSLQLTDKANEQNIFALPACNQAGSIDVSLIAAAKCGDAIAFEELVRRHQRRLRRVAQRITHSREDAVQFSSQGICVSLRVLWRV